jgi:hypothetical protein
MVSYNLSKSVCLLSKVWPIFHFSTDNGTASERALLGWLDFSIRCFAAGSHLPKNKKKIPGTVRNVGQLCGMGCLRKKNI